MNYRITWEGCIPQIKRKLKPAEAAPQPRKSVCVTVKDVLLEVVVFKESPLTLRTGLYAKPWRDRLGEVYHGCPAVDLMYGFFVQWKTSGVVEIDGMIIRWEDFQFARVTYAAREATLP
jgi:hypothetical protein